MVRKKFVTEELTERKKNHFNLFWPECTCTGNPGTLNVREAFVSEPYCGLVVKVWDLEGLEERMGEEFTE